MSRVSYEIDLEYRMKKIFMCRKCNYYVNNECELDKCQRFFQRRKKQCGSA